MRLTIFACGVGCGLMMGSALYSSKLVVPETSAAPTVAFWVGILFGIIGVVLAAVMSSEEKLVRSEDRSKPHH